MPDVPPTSLEDQQQGWYRARVADRMIVLRASHPTGRYPSPFEDHVPGTCIECDALRRLSCEDAPSLDDMAKDLDA